MLTTAIAAALTLGSGAARAQDKPAAAPAAQPGLNFDPSPPAPAAALDMFDGVADWVRRWQTPMDPTGQKPVHAAAVTLRYEGSIVGRGVVISAEPTGASGILMMAASRAMNEARTRLPVPNDALIEDNLRAIVPMIAITVEIAGRPIPITIKEWPDAINEVGPGLDGVAVRMGERIEAMFPETMLVTGTDAAGALAALVSKVSGDPTMGLKKPGELSAKEGVAFYRFKVVQLAQIKAGAAPTFLHRGGRLVSMRDLSEDGLVMWATQLARHLSPTQLGGRGGGPIPGTLSPTTGAREMDEADLRTSAVVGGALACFARTPGVPQSARTEAVAGAEYILAGMCAKFDNGSPEIDAVVESLAQWAMHMYARDPLQGGLPSSMLDHVVEISHLRLWGMPARIEPDRPDGSVKYKPMPRRWPDDTWGSPGAGAIALGLTISAPEGVDSNPDAKQVAETAVRRTFVVGGAAALTSQMPWLGWADLRLPHAGDVPSAAALREMRAQLWQHQLRSEDLPSDAQDQAGGIVFSTTRQSLPTWQCARPLAFVATMLGDPRLTDEGEVNTELARLLVSLRFLRQLTADEAECHMYKDPAAASGGVRNSLFDQRMPPEATALTLLTVCETLKSLEAIKAHRAGAKTDPPAKPETAPQQAPK